MRAGFVSEVSYENFPGEPPLGGFYRGVIVPNTGGAVDFDSMAVQGDAVDVGDVVRFEVGSKDEQTIERLRRLAERPGTENEGRIAREMLSKRNADVGRPLSKVFPVRLKAATVVLLEKADLPGGL